MQQLQAIFWERNSDISSLAQQQKAMRKQDFQERQRIRIQRQNWILKIIKTIKVLTIENKRNIHSSVVRMMSYYRHGAGGSDSIDYQKNFTQDLINLFIGFYRDCCFGGDTAAIKKIVRPNNAFIIIDLVKQLIETHRQYFRVKLLQTFKQAPKLVEDRSKTKFLPAVVLGSRRQLPATEPSEPEEPKKEPTRDVEPQEKLKPLVYEKWQNFVSYSMLPEEALKGKINDAYLELLERNSQNSFMIHKFRQKCYGRSQSFAYNISGLYTQEEVRRMELKLKQELAHKFAHVRELVANPSADQLKQHFKMKVEIQDSLDKLESKRLNNEAVNFWVPIVVQKSGSQHNPLNVYVVFAKELVPISQLQERSGLSLKNFMRAIVKSKVEELKMAKELGEMRNFKRHHFFDLNHAKKKQLMSDQHRVYEKSKKQSIFPLLRSNELRQQSEIAIKNRSMSEYKLAPLFKNDLITRRLEEIESEQSTHLVIAKLQDRKLNMSGRKQSKQECKASKSKIDNIIDLIINQRNLTLAT